jgi:hypothetical protein
MILDTRDMNNMKGNLDGINKIKMILKADAFFFSQSS